MFPFHSVWRHVGAVFSRTFNELLRRGREETPTRRPTQRERGNVTATRYITLSRSEFDRPVELPTEGTMETTTREKKNKEKKVSKGDAKLAKLLHKQARYRHLWEMASAVMAWAVPLPSASSEASEASTSAPSTSASAWLWDGLAVSHNFVGSPHVVGVGGGGGLATVVNL